MTINPDHGAPVWIQLHATPAGRANPARMEVGAMLPSVRTLMQTYGVSDGTVKRALRELRDEGLITTYQGRGSYKVGR